MIPWVIVIGYSVSVYNGNSINIVDSVCCAVESGELSGESFSGIVFTSVMLSDIESTIVSTVVYFDASSEVVVTKESFISAGVHLSAPTDDIMSHVVCDFSGTCFSASGWSECGRAAVSEIVVSDTAGVIPACETEFGESTVTDEVGSCLHCPVEVILKGRSPEPAHSVWFDIMTLGCLA